jgi:SagB-type dehydrogenase family enzyme
MPVRSSATAPEILIPLTPATTTGSIPLETALLRRRSWRRFTSDPITGADLAQLLWAAQGVTGADRHGPVRTAPSAGRTDPLEVFVATPEGLLHYRPPEHAVVVIDPVDRRADLAAAAGDQDCVRDAAAVFAIAGVAARTAVVYEERAGRYVALEVGHAAQNLLLEAIALGLGAVPVGSFDDARVGAVLALPDDWQPFYLIPVGHPAPRQADVEPPDPLG